MFHFGLWKVKLFFIHVLISNAFQCLICFSKLIVSNDIHYFGIKIKFNLLVLCKKWRVFLLRVCVSRLRTCVEQTLHFDNFRKLNLWTFCYIILSSGCFWPFIDARLIVLFEWRETAIVNIVKKLENSVVIMI